MYPRKLPTLRRYQSRQPWANSGLSSTPSSKEMVETLSPSKPQLNWEFSKNAPQTGIVEEFH
jgi:hypothetical protein